MERLSSMTQREREMEKSHWLLITSKCIPSLPSPLVRTSHIYTMLSFVFIKTRYRSSSSGNVWTKTDTFSLHTHTRKASETVTGWPQWPLSFRKRKNIRQKAALVHSNSEILPGRHGKASTLRSDTCIRRDPCCGPATLWWGPPYAFSNVAIYEVSVGKHASSVSAYFQLWGFWWHKRCFKFHQRCFSVLFCFVCQA